MRRRHRWYRLQTKDDRRRKISALLFLLLILGLIHVTAMMVFEGFSFGDSIWLTMTTMTTVGYGDISAGTFYGRLATVALMYLFGIFLLAQIAGEWIDYRLDRKERMRKGLWRWKMHDHIVVINAPDQDMSKYLFILVEQIRGTPLLADYPIQVMSSGFKDGLPNDLMESGVVLHRGHPEGVSSLAEVNVDAARYIILMAEDTSDYRSDSLTLDVLDQLSNFDKKGYIIAECVQESNRDRLFNHGANAVIRPVRAYPELVVRAMAAPGTETILEDLFKYEGSHTRRYDVPFQSQSWGEMASRLLKNGLGTPLGYLGLDSEIVVNPEPDQVVSGEALFLMVSHNSDYQPDRVRELVV